MMKLSKADCNLKLFMDANELEISPADLKNHDFRIDDLHLPDTFLFRDPLSFFCWVQKGNINGFLNLLRAIPEYTNRKEKGIAKNIHFIWRRENNTPINIRMLFRS